MDTCINIQHLYIYICIYINRQTRKTKERWGEEIEKEGKEIIKGEKEERHKTQQRDETHFSAYKRRHEYLV